MKNILLKSINFIGRFLIPLNKKLVCLGGGDIMPFGWVNMDINQWEKHYSYPSWYLDIVFDLMDMALFPFDDETIQCFYCSNLLEHFPDNINNYIFKEVSRCLMPGGYFRIEVPSNYDKDVDTLNSDYDYNHPGKHITAVDFKYVKKYADKVGLSAYISPRNKSLSEEMKGNRFDRRKNMLIVEMRKPKGDEVKEKGKDILGSIKFGMIGMAVILLWLILLNVSN